MIRISNVCIEVLPCVHKVSFNGKTREMDGVQIERLLRKNNKMNSKRYKHFAPYRYWKKS